MTKKRLSSKSLSIICNFFYFLKVSNSRVERQIPQSDDRDALLQFIRSSQRGIIKPYAADAEKA